MLQYVFEHRKRSENIPQGHKLTLFGWKNPISIFNLVDTLGPICQLKAQSHVRMSFLLLKNNE